MPSLQEMLVSYSVKIDESGVSRLHTLLDLNRKKAADTASTFERAEKSIASFGKTLTEPVIKRRHGQAPLQILVDDEPIAQPQATSDSEELEESFYGDDDYEADELDEEGFDVIGGE